MQVRRWIAGACFSLAAGTPWAAGAQSLEVARASVVSVLPQRPPDARRLEEPEGSGVAVLDGRTIVTALHVVDRALSIRVRTAQGEIMEAKLVARDRATDLAILSLRTPVTPIRLTAKAPVLGQPVCAIGNAFGLGLSVTCGVVSGVHRAGIGFNAIEDFVQTDAAVNPGASGGALVTRDGKLVGLLSAIFTKTSDANTGVNFAVSAALVDRVSRRLRDGGRMAWPFSGMRLVAAPERSATGRMAARVVTVKPGSPADKAGLKPGDLIVRAGARRVRKPADFVSALAATAVPAVLSVVIVRAGRERALELKL